MSRVGTVRWHHGTYQVCIVDEPGNSTWAVVEPSWLDWSCIPSAWVK